MTRLSALAGVALAAGSVNQLLRARPAVPTAPAEDAAAEPADAQES
jgi:hypothetical protein